MHQADDAIFKKSVKESPGRILVASRNPIGYRSNEAAMEEEDKYNQ